MATNGRGNELVDQPKPWEDPKLTPAEQVQALRAQPLETIISDIRQRRQETPTVALPTDEELLAQNCKMFGESDLVIRACLTPNYERDKIYRNLERHKPRVQPDDGSKRLSLLDWLRR